MMLLHSWLNQAVPNWWWEIDLGQDGLIEQRLGRSVFVDNVSGAHESHQSIYDDPVTQFVFVSVSVSYRDHGSPDYVYR